MTQGLVLKPITAQRMTADQRAVHRIVHMYIKEIRANIVKSPATALASMNELKGYLAALSDFDVLGSAELSVDQFNTALKDIEPQLITMLNGPINHSKDLNNLERFAATIGNDLSNGSGFDLPKLPN